MKLTLQMKYRIFIIFIPFFILNCTSPSLKVKNVHSDILTENTPTPKLNTLEKNDKSTEAGLTSFMPTSLNQEAPELTKIELQKYAYELGLDPQFELTPEQKKQIETRRRVRQLEKALDSQTERLQYSKVLPWLESDEEKLNLLSIPSYEGRQAWVNKNKIWSRVKSLKDFDEVTESQDIALGMPADYVRKSWGEPEHIDVSGHPIYKNERWKYLKQVSTPQGYRQEKRFVFFEGGRVVGWETE